MGGEKISAQAADDCRHRGEGGRNHAMTRRAPCRSKWRRAGRALSRDDPELRDYLLKVLREEGVRVLKFTASRITGKIASIPGHARLRLARRRDAQCRMKTASWKELALCWKHSSTGCLSAIGHPSFTPS
jgi:hypothetical protein